LQPWPPTAPGLSGLQHRASVVQYDDALVEVATVEAGAELVTSVDEGDEALADDSGTLRAVEGLLADDDAAGDSCDELDGSAASAS
jgi:hypothetical protein